MFRPLRDFRQTHAPDLPLDRTTLQLIRKLRAVGVDTEDVPRLSFFQSLEEGVESGPELAGNAGSSTSRSRCVGFLVFALLLVDIAKGGGTLDRVLSTGGRCSHGFHGLRSGNDGVFIRGWAWTATGLAEKRPLMNGLMERPFLFCFLRVRVVREMPGLSEMFWVVGASTCHDCGETCFAWGCMHYPVLPRRLFSCRFASGGAPRRAGSRAGETVTGAEGNTMDGHLLAQSWTAS